MCVCVLFPPHFSVLYMQWMYRGYNGNLYNRGTRVSTGDSFPKFHQGDVIRCELDLDKGTLSYTVNDISLGVAFKDMEGTIYPAVAFYGAGRKVSLMKVERIGVPMARCPTTYLCTLSETDVSVGFGTPGKRSALGYDKKKVL